MVSGHVLLACSRRHVVQGAVRTDRVVMGSPVVDEAPGIGQIFKPVLVQTTIPEATVAALDKRVLSRLGPVG